MTGTAPTWPPGHPLDADLAPMVFRVRGRLSDGLLLACLRSLAARHEALRITYPELTERDTPAAVADRVLDTWCTVAGSVSAFARSMALTGYRRDGCPLWMVRRLRVTATGTEHLLVGLDRSISDPWSLHVVADELSRLYHADAEPGRAALAAEPGQLGEFLATRRALAGSADALAERAHWRAELAGVGSADQAVSRSAALPAEVRPVALSAATARGLVVLAADRHATVFAAVVAATHLACRLRFPGDPLLLTEVGNRDDPRFDSAVVPAAQLRPIRLGDPADRPFGDVLDHARDALLDALDNCATTLAVDTTPVEPFRTGPERLTVLVEFDTANEPAVAPGQVLLLCDGIEPRTARLPRADLHVMVRAPDGIPVVHLASNPLALDDRATDGFRHALADVLRDAVEPAPE